MSSGRSDRPDQIWERIRRVVFDVVHAVLGPPPPDVTQKVEDVLREARRDWEKAKQCPDGSDETP